MYPQQEIHRFMDAKVYASFNFAIMLEIENFAKSRFIINSHFKVYIYV